MKTRGCVQSLILLAAFMIFAVAGSTPAHGENVNEINYSSSTNIPTTSNPYFMVSVIKYEPYPVNAGDWFDLWIKVQNMGLTDAPNARFELKLDYPFSSNDTLVREYGLINGVNSAYKLDATKDSTQVVLKYRVKVADNAPEGESKLKIITNANSESTTAAAGYDIPIEIAKTKTEFNVKLRDITPQETSFVLTNTGGEPAKAIVFEVEPGNVNFLKETEPSSLGDLNQGDLAVAHVKAIPTQGANAINVKISYTDIAGVRNTVERTVPIDSSMLQNVCTQVPNKDYLRWVFGAVGLLTGVFVMLLTMLILQKRRAAKHHQ